MKRKRKGSSWTKCDETRIVFRLLAWGGPVLFVCFPPWLLCSIHHCDVLVGLEFSVYIYLYISKSIDIYIEMYTSALSHFVCVSVGSLVKAATVAWQFRWGGAGRGSGAPNDERLV